MNSKYISRYVSKTNGMEGNVKSKQFSVSASRSTPMNYFPIALQHLLNYIVNMKRYLNLGDNQIITSQLDPVGTYIL